MSVFKMDLLGELVVTSKTAFYPYSSLFVCLV